MNTIKLTFTPGQTRQVPGGNYLRLISTSAPVTVVFRRRGTPGETAVDVEQGDWFRPERPKEGGDAFEYADITSTVAQTISVGVSRGDAGTDRPPGGSISVESSTGLTALDDVAVPTGGVATLIAAANSARSRIHIVNHSNTAYLRLGGADVTTAKGVRLAPGMGWTFSNTAAIYAANESATDAANCCITEEI